MTLIQIKIQIQIVSCTILACLLWSIALIVTFLGMRSLRSLSDVDTEPHAFWPKVSVIIPACNEAVHIETSLDSHIKTGYPEIEFVLVDDRSTDETPQIINRLAATDRRIRPVHIKKLPDGWLGKVYALHVGQQAADGQWLLFTDADVHMAPDTVKKAISYCQAEQLDFLTAIPRFLPTGNHFLDAAATLSIFGIFAGGRVWKVSDPKARQVAGFGAFLLVRRSVFEKTKGFSWLRFEVADDLGVGLLMKQAGGKCALVNAQNEVFLHFYNSLEEIKSSHEKGGFAILGRYRLGRTILFGLASIFADYLPFIGFFPVGLSWLPILGVFAVLLRITVLIVFVRRVKRPLMSVILFPVGSLIHNLLLIRSGFIGKRKGGIRWRGTFYSVHELRNGQRVFFP